MTEAQETIHATETVEPQVALSEGELRRLVLQIAFWEDWVVRRVETVTILDETRINRHVSMDFLFEAQSNDQEPGSARDRERHIVPVTLLGKQPLRNFNVVDERGVPLPVLSTLENLSLTCQLLVTLSKLPGGPELSQKQVRELITQSDLSAFDSTLDGLLGTFSDSDELPVWIPTFRRLAREFRESFLLAVWMEVNPLERRILKYEYEETMVLEPALRSSDAFARTKRVVKWLSNQTVLRWLMRRNRRQGGLRRSFRRIAASLGVWGGAAWELLGEWLARSRVWLAWDPIRVQVIAQAVARARSYHIELPVPDGLGAVNAELVVGVPGEPAVLISKDDWGIDRVHLHVGEEWADGEIKTRRGMVGWLALELRLRPRELLRQAFFVAWLVSATLGVGLIVRLQFGIHPRLDAVSALIVALPAVFAIFLVAPGEHRLAQRLVTGVRDRIWASAGLAFASAAALTLDLSDGARPELWALLFFAAFLNAAAYFLSIQRADRAFRARFR